MVIKYLKSIGAALAYLAVYIVMIFLTALGFMVYKLFVLMAENPFADLETKVDTILVFLLDNILLVTLVVNVISLLALLLIAKIRKRKIRDRLDLVPVPISNLWPLLILGITLNLTISYVLALLPLPESTMTEYAEAAGRIQPYTFTGFLSAALMAPIYEEVWMRGYIMKTLQKGFPTLLAVFLQALVFGLLHGPIVWVAYSFVIGLLLGIVKLRYRSLYACILLHFSFNASNYLTSPLSGLIADKPPVILGTFIVSLGLSILMICLVMKKTRALKSPAAEVPEYPPEQPFQV
jgi:membrane protease YdiL (CAAX protease family)